MGRRTQPFPAGFVPMTAEEGRAILERRGWTQAQVAESMGVHLRTVQRWLTELEYVPGPAAVLLRIFDKHASVRPRILRP